MPVFRLSDQLTFPPPYLAEENGLLAVGGDLRPARLIAAYRQGIFPWYTENDPPLWWFTSPRLVIFPKELHISRRLTRTIRKRTFEISFDRAFAEVIGACAGIRREKGEDTWISAEMQMAYIELHRLGYAHSVECWQENKLVGGLYGIRLDRVFFGESMFTQKTDASKVALVSLVHFLIGQGVKLIDCQMTTGHLLRFGARELSAKQFQALLRKYIRTTSPDGRWQNDKK